MTKRSTSWVVWAGVWALFVCAGCGEGAISSHATSGAGGAVGSEDTTGVSHDGAGGAEGTGGAPDDTGDEDGDPGIPDAEARGPCEPGRFDLDGVASNGCEARCAGTTCTVGEGETAYTILLSAPPIPETGIAASELTSTGPGAIIMGQPTPMLYPDPDYSDEGFTCSASSFVVQVIGYGAHLQQTP